MWDSEKDVDGGRFVLMRGFNGRAETRSEEAMRTETSG